MQKLIIYIILIWPWIAFSQEGETEKAQSSFVIYPAFGYQPETSFQLGAIAVWILESEDKSQSTFKRQSSLTPFFLYTFKKQILTEVNLDYYSKGGYALNISPRFFNFPDFYFGIGNDNRPSDSESYTNVYWQMEGQFFKPIKEKLFVGTAFDLHHTRLKDIVAGGKLESDSPDGINGGSIFGIGPALKYDTRNNVIYPSKGNLISAQAIINRLGNFDYASYTLDLRRYMTLGNEKNILAIHFQGSFTTGNDIPFYKLPKLGGDNRLRGIANSSLYRDKQSVFTQVEYRRHLFWRVGAVGFIGMGDVSASVKGFDLSEYKYVAGVGYRFAVVPDEKLNLRFDFGISSAGQTGLYIGMREAF